jgi:Ca-activated chloride channel family protein
VSFSGITSQGSYRLVRKFLDMGYMVPHDAIQVEEMLNYFNSYYEDPENENMFRCSSDLVPCPWNKSHELLCLNICARKVNIQRSPPGNLVFLIDASGSMDLPNKLPIVKSAFRLLAKNLRDNDIVSVIEFGGKVRTLLEGIPGSEKGRIIKTIEELQPDGPTPGEEGIRLAYEIARRQFIPGGNNRIILVTDGDINEGASTGRELADLIDLQSRDGIYLTCIGVGMGNYRDPELPQLVQDGQGTFAYADDEQELEKLLVGQLAKTSVTIADGVFITTDFDPAVVKEYRLIGFDNKRGSLTDTASGVEGSRICSGHSLLALFELIPRKDSAVTAPVAEVKINYRLPGHDSGEMISYSCPNNLIPFEKAGNNVRKAACIAMFGMKLRESGCVSQISWAELEKMAVQNFTGNDYINRACIESIARAKKIYRRNNSMIFSPRDP